MDSCRLVMTGHLTQETRVQTAFDDLALVDSARHVMGCRLSQETRVQNVFDDLASTVHKSQPSANKIDTGGLLLSLWSRSTMPS